MTPDLSVTLGNLRFKNPVMVASGTFGYAEEFKGFLDLKKLGAVVSKTITLRERAGNPPPRTCETPAGMLNSIGLENPGADVFIKEKLPVLLKCGAPVIVSIASEQDPREFVALIEMLEPFDIAGIEMNISCPNMKHAGSTGLIAQDPDATHEAVASVRGRTRKLLITKLSPAVASIADIARAAQDAGTDAVSLINTLSGMSIDIETRLPKIAAGTGGLSGPAIKPVAVRMVWEVFQKVRIPVIGMGGIYDCSSALEFIIAGATAISVGTANFVNPCVTLEILGGIQEYLKKKRISSVRELTGTLRHDRTEA
jgi:dihydroorotate dehydrogenase (NAD+) catalytic subunit